MNEALLAISGVKSPVQSTWSATVAVRQSHRSGKIATWPVTGRKSDIISMKFHTCQSSMFTLVMILVVSTPKVFRS